MAGNESDCPHEVVIVHIRVMGHERYTWSASDGLVWEDAGGKAEKVPKSGLCGDCGKRVYRNFDRKG